MVNLTFYLNPYKKSKKTGLVPIVANYAFNYKDSQGETIYKNVSKSVSSVKIDHWSKSKQRVHESKTFEEANLKTNPMLDSMQADAKKYFSELEAQKIEITVCTPSNPTYASKFLSINCGSRYFSSEGFVLLMFCMA